MGPITGVWLLALVMFTTPTGAPTVQVGYYATQAGCQDDMVKSMNAAFTALGGHEDFTATCYYVPRRIGS